MICAKEGSVKFNGTLHTLLSEYSFITKEFREMMSENFDSEEEAQRLLKRAYDLGCMSDDEMDKELELLIEKFEKSSAAEFLRNLFFGGAKHDPD